MFRKVHSIAEIKELLEQLPSEDLTTCLMVGSILKAELGLSGYDLFHEFCEKAHNFDRGWVKSTWKGCRPDKGLGYLYWLVKNQ
jgi:putative DNA primase/helicase